MVVILTPIVLMVVGIPGFLQSTKRHMESCTRFLKEQIFLTTKNNANYGVYQPLVLHDRKSVQGGYFSTPTATELRYNNGSLPEK